jgi:hypothetical protein
MGSIWSPNHKNSDARDFWNAVTDQDWEKGESILRQWAPKTYANPGSDARTGYKNRRNAEADYLRPVAIAQDRLNRPHPR